MAVTITFHTVKEKKPSHQEDIIWLKSFSSFHMSGFEPKEVSVEYQWTSLDEDGYPDGNAWVYEGEDDLKEIGNPSRVRLDLLFNGWIPTDEDLWISQEDYWNCFNKGDHE